MEIFLYKLLGALSGLALYWSASPQVKNWNTAFRIAIGTGVSTVGAPFTAQFLDRWASLSTSADGLFVSAALNGIILLPLVRYVHTRAESGK